MARHGDALERSIWTLLCLLWEVTVDLENALPSLERLLEQPNIADTVDLEIALPSLESFIIHRLDERRLCFKSYMRMAEDKMKTKSREFQSESVELVLTLYISGVI